MKDRKKMGPSATAILAAVMLWGIGAGAAEQEETIFADQVAASTALGGEYGAWNLQDGSLSTAWVEGEAGNGIGSFLDFTFPAGTVLTGLDIYPGYLKSEKLFWSNSAPTVLEVRSADIAFEIGLSGIADSYAACSGGYHAVFAQPLVCTGSVRVTLKDVRAGSVYTDTCISELHFFGTGRQAATGALAVETEAESQPGSEQGETPQTESAAQRQNKLDQMAAMASWLYTARNGYGEIAPMDLALADFTPQEMAFLLYYYQYHYKDSRIATSGNGEYHTASKADLEEILRELFGTESAEAMQVFVEDFAAFGDQDPITMYATGDFGDAGAYFFGEPKEITTANDGRILLRGDVLIWSNEDGSYLPGLEYSVYLTEEAGAEAGPYRLNEVLVE